VLYFGGAHNDYFTFYASDIKVNTKIPPIYITDFLLFNKSLPVSTDKSITPLKNNILVTDEIKLKYDQNSFGFEFAALNYLLPEKNQYAYKLDGFDKDWSYTDYKRRYANYTNLSPGEYLFQVKASNNDGVWNETGDRLQIIIMPPYWQTWYAFVLYVILLALLIYTARYITIKQTRLKSSLEVEHLLREREEEDYKQRINFFTNISHEFRTPLTLISGPLKQIVNHSKKSEWNTDITSYLNLIQRNVKRLTELANQLLDFRKLESGKMKLELSLGDIIYFTQKVTETFHDLADKKSIQLEFISQSESCITYFDADKLEKIISNLVANAVKFTEKGGVTVKVREIYRDKLEKDKRIEITVEDSGIGIAEDELKNIFNPFHQVDLSQTQKNEGTGIGLALTANLVKLYNGEIKVTSQLGKGSCFTVVLPVEKENLSDFVLINPEGKESVYADKETEESDGLETTDLQQKQVSNKNKPLLLVVEDNQDMRFYISKILSEKFQVIEAENGKEGLTRAFEVIPDIIISDVMMPELSGIELTNRLKSDERTSHIPVILLTALTTKKQKIKGLKTGADDYITKPFSEEILRLKTENFLENRSKIREQLIKQIESTTQLDYGKNIQPSVVEFENVNEIFINKLVTIIELNIQEVDFGVEKLAREIGMEASTLYKKMMALIDIAPGEFIREIRLKRAAQLLAQKHLTVTDVSFMVGYDDPKYFSKIFKKYHAVSPSEYRNNLID
jgi:signal transduction histidine kinase/DNA-binding response OmpR family regulator